MKKIGIIDLGSNSVRLVIFEIKSSGAFRLVDDISDNVRLSENMTQGKYLNDFSMRRALKTVKLFKKLCTAYKIPPKDIIAVATEAVRKSANKDQFLKLLNFATGLDFKVLSGEEEALYVYKAVSQTIDIKDGVIVDIGGGSTEIIKFADGIVSNHVSIPLGSVVATENYLEKDIIPSEKLDRFERQVGSILSQFDWLTAGKTDVIIGLGGTIRNMSKIHRRQLEYPLETAHNYALSVSDFYSIYNSLKSMDLESRKKVKGISVKRADIIVGGLSILKSITALTGANHIIVSGSGLREGVLFEYLSRRDNGHEAADVLDLSLENYMSLYNIRYDHARHICHLSLSLFDQLKSLHKLGSEERKLLKAASLLHDIGISISYYGHYNHSFYMIMNSRLYGLSHREIILTAAIAASHGQEKFKEDWVHKYKTILQKGDIRVHQTLSLFLKIAECLDRSETGIVKEVECSISKETVRINARCSGDAELELGLANDNSDDFKKLFKRSMAVVE